MTPDYLNDAQDALDRAIDLIKAERETLDREDPRGRHLSLAITHAEDALLRIRQAQETK